MFGVGMQAIGLLLGVPDHKEMGRYCGSTLDSSRRALFNFSDFTLKSKKIKQTLKLIQYTCIFDHFSFRFKY